MNDVPHCCTSCGDTGGVQHLVDALETKEEALRLVEIDLRKARAKASRLQAEQNAQEKLDPMYEDAVEVYEYWRRLICPTAREFTGERLKAVLGRLHAGRDKGELMRAVDGAKRKPMKGRRTTDLLTICRNETNLQMFLDFAEGGDREPALPEGDLQRAQQRLTPRVAERLADLKGWTSEAIEQLGLGFDGSRIVFPFRDAYGRLVGLGRYSPPSPSRNGSKMLADGKRELFPAPESLTAESVWLVEGEPDAVSMASVGLPAVAVPGVGTWKDGWAERFQRFERVRICFDCDEEGRECAAKRSAALASFSEVSVVDLDPERDDKYDVGDLVLEQGLSAATSLARLSGGPASTVFNLAKRREERDPYAPPPFVQVCERLERMGLSVKRVGDGRVESQCPNHDDRNPSLSVTEGDDQRVLLHCHTGCEFDDVVAALGLEKKDLFAA